MSGKGTSRTGRKSRRSLSKGTGRKPARTATGGEKRTATRSTRAGSGKRTLPMTVLIIDEEQDSVREAQTHLEAEGYRVIGVADPREGLRLAKEGRVALVMVDIALAEMTGYQVCKSLTTDDRTFNIPVVFLTHKTDPADRLLGFLAGGSDYITKPFTRDTIVQGVNKLLRR